VTSKARSKIFSKLRTGMAVSPDNATKNPRQTNQDRAYRFSKAREKRNKKSLKIGDF
jgi:hypothetical protein